MADETRTGDAALAQSNEPRAFIVIDHLTDTERESQVIDLPDRIDVTVGRSSSCTVYIDDESVSRMHARIRRTGDTIVVEDLVSRSGTRVNGVRITELTHIRAGDEIAIGPIVAIVGITSALRRAPMPEPTASPIVVEPAMKRVFELAERIADTPITVLVLGETGVGKEIVAEMLHQRSSRRDKPFVKLNCAALPSSLLESELFGHERGAFTGADRRKEGYFEAARGGTLFLDEIGEISATVQAKLLRVLERKVIIRVGGTSEVGVDTRLVAATHRDLDAESRAGRFRQDLFYRICGFTIVIPPLRERAHEIMPLANHFAHRTSFDHGRPKPTFSPDACAALTTYAWPGNVRELRNAIERAVLLCDGTITASDLPDRIAGEREMRGTAADVRDHVAAAERATILAALEEADFNQTHAARRLGLSRRTLIYRMEKYGLKPRPGRE